MDLPTHGDLGEIACKSRIPARRGHSDARADKDRPSRNYEFFFLFSKRADYRFDRTMIDIPARKSYKEGDKANAGSVWETEILSDTDPGPDGLWRVNQEASRYPQRCYLAACIGAPDVASDDLGRGYGARSVCR